MRAVRSEIDPSHTIFIAPSRTHSLPSPERAPDGSILRNEVLADECVHPNTQFARLVGILICGQILR